MTTYRHRITGPGPAGDIWVTTLHTSSSQSLSAVHSAFQSFVTSFVDGVLVPMWPTDVQAQNIYTDQLDPVTGKNVAQQSSTVNYKGTGTGLTLPQRVAVVVGLRTASPTKAGRGRMFFPAPDSTHLTSTGLLNSTDANTISAGMATSLQSLAATATPVIYHRAAKTTTAITEVTVGQVLGTQRRRSNKVANNYQVQVL